MFSLCANMKWAHLPVAGGIYDQSPEFIEQIEIIFAAIGRKTEQDRKKQEQEMKTMKSKRR